METTHVGVLSSGKFRNVSGIKQAKDTLMRYQITSRVAKLWQSGRGCVDWEACYKTLRHTHGEAISDIINIFLFEIIFYHWLGLTFYSKKLLVLFLNIWDRHKALVNIHSPHSPNRAYHTLQYWCTKNYIYSQRNSYEDGWYDLNACSACSVNTG